ncbi:DJ-1/PfpI family protein [Mycobacterium sp. MBM]|nr:DJ-1/PfpI family protein [Mycobacterium sp. MBM]
MCHYVEHRSRHIAILAGDGARTLDVTGPLEVFDAARTLGADYTVSLHTYGDSSVLRCASGLAFAAEPASLMDPTIDTLVLLGGESYVCEPVPSHVRRAVRDRAAVARRIAAIDTGVFALGAAGLLEGRRATTHWRHLDAFVTHCPSTIVDRESVFVRDDDIWTSAGSAAGIDLALALVADDHGSDLAHEISRDMVVLSRRMEGHPQISAAARTPRPKHTELERLMATISADPAGHYELDVVAARIGMSPRHLARLFKAQVGVTLRQYVYEVRLENAVGLVLAGESFHAAARRSGLRYGARIRDHLQAHRVLPEPPRPAPLLVDPRGAKPVPVHTG